MVNDALSIRRTQTVRTLINSELTQLKLVAPIIVQGNGERNLPVKTDDLVNECRNRRVEMTLTCQQVNG
jgi:outer membrane protein OmpA-like peptidoglycan-associated protein